MLLRVPERSRFSRHHRNDTKPANSTDPGGSCPGPWRGPARSTGATAFAPRWVCSPQAVAMVLVWSVAIPVLMGGPDITGGDFVGVSYRSVYFRLDALGLFPQLVAADDPVGQRQPWVFARGLTAPRRVKFCAAQHDCVVVRAGLYR